MGIVKKETQDTNWTCSTDCWRIYRKGIIKFVKLYKKWSRLYYIMKSSKNVLNASTLSILYYIKQRKVIIIIGAVLLTIGTIAAVTIGHIVINDSVDNNLTPQGYPATEFLGISAFSYEYGSVFTAILGLFILSGGIIGMDSKKEGKKLTK